MNDDIYENFKHPTNERAGSKGTEPKHEDVYINEDFMESHQGNTSCEQLGIESGAVCSRSRCSRLITGCLVLLLVILLLVFIVLLLMKHTTVTTEKIQLQARYNNLSTENVQLQARYNNLSTENVQLQARYNNLSTENVQLQLKKDELQMLISTLSDLDLKAQYFNYSVFWITNKKTTWHESRQICKAKKADLVMINSREKQEFIRQHFSSNEAWIGLSDKDKEGEWKWIDGSALTTSLWWDGEPNDFRGNEDCGITSFHKAKSSILTWADYPCNFPVLGICEMKTKFNIRT